MKGQFITVEGTEGVGKTTNIACIEKWLTDKGIPYLATREPGGTLLGEKVRELLLDRENTGMDPTAELLLMFAARAQHLAEKIIPALEAGQWVLCDRFTDATYAYQGAGRGLNCEHIASLEHIVQGSLRPDFTLILDIEPEQGMARVRKRGEVDRFEAENVVFFDRVRDGYQACIAKAPERYCLVDAGETLPQVQKAVIHALNTFANRCA